MRIFVFRIVRFVLLSIYPKGGAGAGVGIEMVLEVGFPFVENKNHLSIVQVHLIGVTLPNCHFHVVDRY